MKKNPSEPYRSAKKPNRRVGQGICMVCGKYVRPGNGIVKEYGKGGRICKACVMVGPNE